VRDGVPFVGRAPLAAMFYYSRDRAGEHPQACLANYTGVLQADAYSGCNKLYEADRKPGPILEAGCWSHARRKFFELADLVKNARRKADGKNPTLISPGCHENVSHSATLLSSDCVGTWAHIVHSVRFEF
jgi:transposase